MEKQGEASQSFAAGRSNKNLADIMFDLSVNFLLYVVLIIVFYMFTRFYLEEEVAIVARDGYSLVSTEEEEDGELVKDAVTDESKNTTEPLKQIVAIEKKQTGEASKTPRTPISKMQAFLNVQTPTSEMATRQEVIQRLVICSLGLVVMFTIWGIMQERILSQTYDGVFFEDSYGLVFMNRLGGLILSCYLMFQFSVPWCQTALWEYSFPSVANMLSSWCQYEALRYVSFPVVMLAKAFKMVPIMIVGRVLNNKSYDSYEYISGALVGLGLYLFMNSTENLQFTVNVFGDPENITGAFCGVFLLFLYLIFDSSTGQWQSRIFEHNPAISPLQMMATMNAFSTLFSFITLIHQEQLSVSIAFVTNHPQILFHMSIFVISGTIGQLFIFYTVKHFGPVVFSIIMSIRILVSTFASCFLYGHAITEMGYLGIIIVIIATVYRLVKKTEGKRIISWPQSDQEASGNIFKEWHEHLDI